MELVELERGLNIPGFAQVEAEVDEILRLGAGIALQMLRVPIDLDGFLQARLPTQCRPRVVHAAIVFIDGDARRINASLAVKLSRSR